MDNEGMEILTKVSDKVDALSRNVKRINDILDEIAAVLEIRCDNYDIRGIKITKKEFILQTDVTECRKLKNYSTIGELASSLNHLPLMSCYIKSKHRNLPISKLPKLETSGIMTPSLKIIIKI